jgi:uncharacterized protein HemY
VDDPEKAALCFERAAALGKKRNNPQLAALAVAEYLSTQGYFEEAESSLLNVLPKVKPPTTPLKKPSKSATALPQTKTPNKDQAPLIEPKTGLPTEWKTRIAQPMSNEVKIGLTQLYERWGDTLVRSEDESDTAIEQAFIVYLKGVWLVKPQTQTDAQLPLLQKLNTAGSQLLDRYELNSQFNQNLPLLEDWEKVSPSVELNLILGQAYSQQSLWDKAYQQLRKAYTQKPNTAAPLLVKVLQAKQKALDPNKDFAKIKAIEGSINTLVAQHNLKGDAGLFPKTSTLELKQDLTPKAQSTPALKD